MGAAVGFHAVVEENPDRLATIDPDGTTMTFRELSERVNRISHALRAAGLRQGECVVTVTPNSSLYHAVRLATAQVGLYLTPISHHLTPPEVAYILRDCAAKLIIADAGVLDVVAPAVDESPVPQDARIIVGGEREGWRSLGSWLRGQPVTTPGDLSAGDYMGYTSGTTGAPKAVRKPLSGRPPALSSFTRTQMSRLGMEPGEFTHLVCGPLYHSAPGTFSTAALQLGHTVVIAERPRPEEILELIERHRVSELFTVPTVLRRLLRLPGEVRRSADLSSLVSVIHAGAPCPPDVKRAAIEWLGAIINEFYGTTEGSATTVSSPEWLAHPGTVGKPLPGVSVAILDDDGNEVPAGKVGTIYFTPPVPFEYLNAPEKTAEAMRGKLFSAGDLGYLDEEGWLFTVDRRTDLILSGGVNIYPAEVEAALLQHRDVADAAVIGVPDPDWGQRLVAVVQPEDEVTADAELARDLETHCRALLAGYKVPRVFRFDEALPRSSTGKLLRRVVREKFASPDANQTSGLYGPEHEDFRATARKFLQTEVVPHYPEWDAAGLVPREIFTKIGELGLIGIPVPVEYGGSGADTFLYSAVWMEETQRAFVNLGGLSVHMNVVLPYLLSLGSHDQKSRWLPGIVRGELLTSIAMSEPGTGSDLAGIVTKAHRDGDHYVLNGAKIFVTGGINADLVVVVARTSVEENRRGGLSLLVVETTSEGFTRGRNLDKIGLKTQDTAELFFDNVRVPAGNLLGEEGKAFSYLTSNLPQERLAIAVASQAAAEAALDTTVDYVRNRKAFGTTVASFQNTKFELAACSVDVSAGRALLDDGLRRHEARALTPVDAARVKVFCTEMQARVVDRCLQLHGGYGYIRELPIARLYADARVARIYGGTTEVLKTIIAKSLGL